MKYSKFVYENRFKLFKTFAIYLTYFTIGCSTGLLGSGLLDLQILSSTDFTKISLLVTLRSVGHVLGTVIAGLIGSYFNESLVLSITSFAAGLFSGLAPLLVKFELVGSCIFIAGLNYGIADVLSNTLLTRTWKEKCTNFLQALQMCGGMGSLIAPVIARPFLLPSQESIESSNTIANGSSIIPDPITTPILYTPDDVMIHIAFLILGFIGLISSIPYFIIYFTEKKIVRASVPSVQSKPAGQHIEHDENKWKLFIAITLVTIIGHAVYGFELVIGSLATSFSVKSDLHMDKKSGVLLATVFWSCFSFYRLIYIPLTFIFSESKLLLSSLIISTVGLLITVPWANNSETCIWVGFTLIGLGISPVFAASYGLLNKYMRITSRVTSIIFSIGIIGESFHPAIVASLMSHNMIIFLYYLGVLGIIYILSFATLIVYCKKAFKGPINHHPPIGEKLSLSISHF